MSYACIVVLNYHVKKFTYWIFLTGYNLYDDLVNWSSAVTVQSLHELHGNMESIPAMSL